MKIQPYVPNVEANVVRDGPGEWSVADVKKRNRNIVKGLLLMFNMGILQFDWWEKDILPNGKLHRVVLSTRPFVHSNHEIAWPAYKESRCKLLGASGCQLCWERRPQGCKDLIPALSYPNCEDTIPVYDKRSCVMEWRSRQHYIREVIRLVKEQEDG